LSATRASRAVVFGFCTALLCAAAVAFAASTKPAEPSAPAGPAGRPLVWAREKAAVRDALRRDARRFLLAFLRYEVGETGGDIRQVLRQTSTAGFANSLLRRPSPSPVSPPGAASLAALSVTVLSALPPRALIRGAALREGGTEQFSFLFEARHGVWLASGPGE
jgi:hypothetical protein